MDPKLKTLILFDIDNTLISKFEFKEWVLSKKIFHLKNSDTNRLVESLSKKNTLGIWSQGFFAIQKYKLTTTNIWKYFDENQVWISHHKLNLLKKIENQAFTKIYIIDDKNFSHLNTSYPKIEFLKTEDNLFTFGS